jgi:peptidoglycan/LPS O-acetylase OafA/YrhL
MGLLRLFLALSVVLVHSYPLFGYKLMASNVAVHSFFIISGFYMAFILHEKYIGRNGSYRLFITNRFLRIYPLYWVIILLLISLSLIEFILFPSPNNEISFILKFASESSNPPLTLLITIFRNITLIFTTDYFQNNFQNAGYLILLVAWTLQVELIFYLIAPFVTKLKTPLLIVLTCLFGWITFGNLVPSLFANINPTLTGLFLSKFIFFLFGILSYEIYRKLKPTRILKRYSLAVCILFFVVTLLFGYYSTTGILITQNNFLYYYLLVMVSLPFLFSFSKKKRLDRSLADLSYPVYLSHILVFKVVTNTPLQYLQPGMIASVTIAATLGFSYLLVKTIEKPIDRQRKKMLE